MVRDRMSGIIVFLLFSLGSSLSGGCSKSAASPTDVDFACEIQPTPHRVGLNTFTITLTASKGERLAGARIALEGDMSHPGMSPAFSEAKEITPGRYQGTLDLNMRGDWTVLFHITLPNGRSFDRQVDVRNLQAS
jgi:YtkA-like